MARDVITNYERSVRRNLTPESPLLLGSASPRRRELLESVGVPLVVAAPKVDEALRERESWNEYLERVSAAKLVAAASLNAMHALAVLVADTVVTCDARVLDKPATPDAARAALERLSGRSHEVSTRFLLGEPNGDRVTLLHAETVTSIVTFRALTAAEIEAYVRSGEGFDKAGGYGIQSGAAGFVSRIAGSYTSVVGLPLAEVVVALRGARLWA